MSRVIRIGAAQLGPIQRSDDRTAVVQRLIAMLHQAADARVQLVVYPELALTTFFPRWFVDDIAEADHWYEREMPSPVTRPLFDEAKRLGIGFCLGYAELTSSGERFNTQILVDAAGATVAKYRKVHIPGHEHHEPDRPFQHAERYYFTPSDEGFGVWEAFGGRVGMMICNDRRWPESYRVMGLQGVEMVLLGYAQHGGNDAGAQVRKRAGMPVVQLKCMRRCSIDHGGSTGGYTPASAVDAGFGHPSLGNRLLSHKARPGLPHSVQSGCDVVKQAIFGQLDHVCRQLLRVYSKRPRTQLLGEGRSRQRGET